MSTRDEVPALEQLPLVRAVVDETNFDQANVLVTHSLDGLEIVESDQLRNHVDVEALALVGFLR